MKNLPSKIFIDGGEPEETGKANQILLEKLGRPLDGQTTNPSLIAKNLQIKLSGKKKGSKLTPEMALDEYKRIVEEMSSIIPDGSISIQVFADSQTTAEEMLHQARERVGWISNASIKFPCTHEGLKAAKTACREMPINITLVFSQQQAAAVYQVTKKTKYPIFISPFVGRLDDKGENGMDVIKNILKMYSVGDGHVEVLTASIRNIEHLYYALFLKSDIVTVPFSVFQLWADNDFKLPDNKYIYKPDNLKEIPYQKDVTLGKNWQDYDLYHPLTKSGVDKFYSDWMGLFK